MTHICVGDLTITGSDNGLSPGRRQAITWTNARILLIGPLGTNFSEMLLWIQTFSFKEMHFKMSSVKWHPFCLGLNVLILNPARRSNYIHYNVRHRITYPFQNFNGSVWDEIPLLIHSNLQRFHRCSLGMDKYFHPHFTGYVRLGLR